MFKKPILENYNATVCVITTQGFPNSVDSYL